MVIHYWTMLQFLTVVLLEAFDKDLELECQSMASPLVITV